MFTNWVNVRLAKRELDSVQNLYTDLANGFPLYNLLEILSGTSLRPVGRHSWWGGLPPNLPCGAARPSLSSCDPQTRSLDLSGDAFETVLVPLASTSSEEQHLVVPRTLHSVPARLRRACGWPR